MYRQSMDLELTGPGVSNFSTTGYDGLPVIIITDDENVQYVVSDWNGNIHLPGSVTHDTG